MALKLEKLAEGTLTVDASTYLTMEDGTRLVTETQQLLDNTDGIKKIIYKHTNYEVRNRIYDLFGRGREHKIHNPLEAKEELHMEIRK